MPDVLVVTGPMNSTQLGVPKDAEYRVIHVHPTGSDIGSNAHYAATQAWLGGRSIRERVALEVGDLGLVGVAWFSAGHGSVRAILETSVPQDVAAWLCIDGLYGSNKWAIDVAAAAMRNETSIMATASTSTPGPYDHSLGRWRATAAEVGLPEVVPDAATQWGLPAPQQCWGEGSCLVAGYNDLDHFHQVPATREAMLRWWQIARTYHEPLEPDTLPPLPERGPSGGWILAAAIGLFVGFAGYSLYSIVKEPKGWI